MGYCYVTNSGMGLYLKYINKDCFKNIPIPNKEVIIKYLKDNNREIIVDELDDIHLLQYMFMDNYNYRDYIKSNSVYNFETLKNYLYNVLGEDYCERFLTSSLAFLFCYKYNYPLDSFRSVYDYNGDNMIFCSYQYPPLEYNDKMAKLTMPILEAQLKKFMYDLTEDENYLYQKICLCEEYIKE